MQRRSKLTLASTLRKVRDPVIHIECKRCNHAESFNRCDIVKRHKASVTFSQLRRVIAMGCDRFSGPDGDTCETRFLCLDE